jgi:excisionase family DNA binding protein
VYFNPYTLINKDLVHITDLHNPNHPILKGENSMATPNNYEVKTISTINMLKGDDVCKALNVSRAQAYNLMRKGIIPAIRIGNNLRVKEEDLFKYLEECRISKSS